MRTTSKSPAGHISLSEAIEIYASHVEWVDGSDEVVDVGNTLVWRDTIAERIAHKDRLSPGDRKRLDNADQVLRAKATSVYRRHRAIFDDNRERVPDDYWWWKLGVDEGATAG